MIYSTLGSLALLASFGNGAYVEVGSDLAWHDRVGLVARGSRVIGEVGYFWGDFHSFYRFGSYFRTGFGFSWEPTYLHSISLVDVDDRGAGLIEQSFFPHLTLTRGANILNLGIYGKLRLGPVWSTERDDVFYSSEDVIWGGSIVGEVGGVYNVGTSFSLGPRLGIGYILDELRSSFQVTLGFNFLFSFPFNGKKENPWDDWEQEY